MDAWNKSLTWGLGGDQVRILDRKVEALLLAAEMLRRRRLGARARSQGGTPGQGLERSAGLAEPRRGPVRVLALAGRPHGPARPDRGQPQLHLGRDRLQPPRRRPETGPGRPRRRPGPPREAASIRATSRPRRDGGHSSSIRTPGSRTDLATTGRIYPVPPKTRGRRRQGPRRPHRPFADRQEPTRTPTGNLVVAEVASRPRKCPRPATTPIISSSRPRGRRAVEDRSADRRIEADAGERIPPRPPRSDDRRRRQPRRQGLGREMLDPAQGAFPALHRPADLRTFRAAQSAGVLRQRQVQGRRSTGWPRGRCGPRCAPSMPGST